MRIALAGEAGVLRWGVSFAFALLLHVLAIGLFLEEQRADEPAVSAVPPVMLDLIALPVEADVAPDEAVSANSDAPSPPAILEASSPEPAEPPSTCGSQAAAPADSSPSVATTLTEWKDLLQRHLEHYKRYPADAQRQGQQGTPHVFFTACRDGRVLAVHVVRTSGFSILDQAGMDLVRSAEPLPAFPQGLSAATMNLVVPVEFFLARAGR